MKCPHCGMGINFEEQKSDAVYSCNLLENHELGIELVHGFCPVCNKIIVILKEGKYKLQTKWKAVLVSITKEEILYPKVLLPKALDPEIPKNYKDDYFEAYSVLTLGPKASAAISKRLLQHILRDEFKLRKQT